MGENELQLWVKEECMLISWLLIIQEGSKFWSSQTAVIKYQLYLSACGCTFYSISNMMISYLLMHHHMHLKGTHNWMYKPDTFDQSVVWRNASSKNWRETNIGTMRLKILVKHIITLLMERNINSYYIMSNKKRFYTC